MGEDGGQRDLTERDRGCDGEDKGQRGDNVGLTEVCRVWGGGGECELRESRSAWRE